MLFNFDSVLSPQIDCIRARECRSQPDSQYGANHTMTYEPKQTAVLAISRQFTVPWLGRLGCWLCLTEIESENKIRNQRLTVSFTNTRKMQSRPTEMLSASAVKMEIGQFAICLPNTYQQRMVIVLRSIIAQERERLFLRLSRFRTNVWEFGDNYVCVILTS